MGNTQVWKRITLFGPVIAKLKLNLNTGPLVLSSRERFLCTVPHTVLKEFCLVKVRNVWGLGFVLVVVYGKTQGDYSKLCKGTWWTRVLYRGFHLSSLQSQIYVFAGAMIQLILQENLPKTNKLGANWSINGLNFLVVLTIMIFINKNIFKYNDSWDDLSWFCI